MRISAVSGLAAGIILVVATACGGSSASQAPTQAGQSGPACGGSGGTAVAIQNFAFAPPSVTVSADGSVTWTNNDTSAHTVTFDDGPDCGNVPGGASVSATFSGPGTFAYHCTIHPSMKGSVTVS